MASRFFAAVFSLFLAGCVSVRTVEVAPSPNAVAGFVASTLGEGEPRRTAVVPADSVLETWYASDLNRRARGVRPGMGRALAALDRVETFSTPRALVEVFVYGDEDQATQASRGILEAFGYGPLHSLGGNSGGDYYVTGPLVVRVLARGPSEAMSLALDDGLGRPRYSMPPSRYRARVGSGRAGLRASVGGARNGVRERAPLAAPCAAPGPSEVEGHVWLRLAQRQLLAPDNTDPLLYDMRTVHRGLMRSSEPAHRCRSNPVSEGGGTSLVTLDVDPAA